MRRTPTIPGRYSLNVCLRAVVPNLLVDVAQRLADLGRRWPGVVRAAPVQAVVDIGVEDRESSALGARSTGTVLR